MKIIDILNKKANGTLEDGFRFCYNETIYTYCKKTDAIKEKRGDMLGSNDALEKRLNDEVELFRQDNKQSEENREIEKLYSKEEHGIFVNFSSKDTEEINELRKYIKTNVDKINELVREVNKIKKNMEDK